MNSTKPNTATRKPRRMARSPEAPQESGSADCNNASDVDAAEPNAPPRVTKQAIVLNLLRRDDGALLSDIVEATGWLPHTARAALTGLKKKGHAITSTKVDKITRYALAGGA